MKIAVFADCHIGSYGTKADPESGLNARLLDTVESVRFVKTDAMTRGVDVVLFAGDMFRTHKPTPTELMLAQNALAGMPDLAMIDGNHDIPRASGESSALKPLVRMLPGHTDDTSLPAGWEKDGVQIVTLPYPNRGRLAAVVPDFGRMSPEQADQAVTNYLTAILRQMASPLQPGKPSILMAHISVDVAEPGAERGIMAGRDVTIPLSAIPEAFTYVALGHIHYAQDFSRYGRPNVFYCGSTSRIDFGEEGQEKGYVVIDTEAGTCERVSIPCREFRTIHINLSDSAAGDSSYSLKDSICRVKITRPESVKPDYDHIRKTILDAGAWEFTGFVEDVTRTQQARSESIARAEGIPELLTAWHESSNCEQPLDDLAAAAQELEESIR